MNPFASMLRKLRALKRKQDAVDPVTRNEDGTPAVTKKKAKKKAKKKVST